MTELIIANGLIVLLAIVGSLLLWDAHSNSMFFDIGSIFRFYVITIPLFAAVVNFIALIWLYPEHLWLSALPLLIPISVILWQQNQNRKGARVWNQFSSFSAELVQEAKLHGVILLPEDVRVRIMEGKNMVYVLNAYSEEEEVAFKSIEKDLVRATQQAFPIYGIKIYIDKKRSQHTT